MSRLPRIAVIVETSIAFGREVLKGVSSYVHKHRPWSMFLQQLELDGLPPDWILNKKWDGIICRPLNNERFAQAFKDMNIPVINLNDTGYREDFPRVNADHHEMGRMGARYLLEKGFKHFAFCNFTDQYWSNCRQKGFEETIASKRYEVSVYGSDWLSAAAPEWDVEQQKLVEWVKSLPKPLALMACNDVRGQQVLDACQLADILVPDEVCVLGVDNSEVYCELCRPPLSSVDPNAMMVGYEAARLLDHYMEHGTPEQFENHLIKPLQVVTRQSTNNLAIDDPDVKRAIYYIRENALYGCKVKDILKSVPISRSLLEQRFRKYLGRSPQNEIMNVRLNKAKQLLIETDIPLKKVAQMTGFKHAEYFNVVFKREIGIPPGQFRLEGKTP